MNKLVRGILVRGLPLKLFENDYTCVACQKGKQHKASCKTKTVSSICKPLQLLHMDLFGQISIRSINKKSYCLVVTDDFSRFSWVFFLATKDETPEILKNFITSIENQIDHKVNNQRPFGCPVTILKTLDHLGKFDGKSNDGFFVGYSINSKAFRVFNTRTKIVEENLHINFLENKPNVAGTRPNWMFDIDTLTMSMNYQPVSAGNQTNGNAGTKANIDADQARKKAVPSPQYVLLPFFTFDSQGSRDRREWFADDAGKKNGVLDPTKEGDKNGQEKDVRDQEEALRKKFEQESERLFGQGEATNNNSTNRLNTVSSSINVVSSSFTIVDLGRERAQRNEFESVFGQDKDANGNSIYRIFTPVSAVGSSYENLSGSIPVNTATLPNADLPTYHLMPDLEDTADLQVTGIFSGTYDDEVEGAVADFNNFELTTVVSPIPSTRIHTDHPKEQIIRDPLSAPQTKEI
ncbi:ribonuclease H-like domain-containing protein [Tanacetum coccineum]|uniref:Ribonuclease H-like domain-containing protein n=1 Tax=Tanacetum coccineum TaxID=301880 RepID=A0ABQ4ZRU2_9ASTR